MKGKRIYRSLAEQVTLDVDEGPPDLGHRAERAISPLHGSQPRFRRCNRLAAEKVAARLGGHYPSPGSTLGAVSGLSAVRHSTCSIKGKQTFAMLCRARSQVNAGAKSCPKAVHAPFLATDRSTKAASERLPWAQ